MVNEALSRPSGGRRRRVTTLVFRPAMLTWRCDRLVSTVEMSAW
jgi:hypothetical protein